MRLTKQDVENQDIEVTGHFANVISAAERAGAYCISIQTYYTFCSFRTREAAEQFRHEMLAWCAPDVSTINCNRPYVPFEVMVHHPR